MKVSLLIPVYDDYDSLNLLLNNIDIVLSENNIQSNIIIIDDASIQKPVLNTVNNYYSFENIEFIQLDKNVGHQMAIAIGLGYINEKYPLQNVIIMDTDGEDDPKYIPKLISAAYNNNCGVVFAERQKRRESLVFKFGYFIYKCLFILRYSFLLVRVCLSPHSSKR